MQLQLDTLGDIGDNLRSEIEENSHLITFTKDDSLFDYDTVLEYFYIFLSGKVKVYQLNLDNSKEQTIYLMNRGDMYDVVTLLDGQVHEVIVEILEPGTVLRIPIGKAREWMYDYPIFGEIVLKYISKQLRKIEGLATDLTLFDTQERLIKLLIQNIEIKDEQEKNILDGLSHAQIASLIGTVRHVVDRHIKQLKTDGILEDQRKKISLKSREKLLDRMKNLS
ncbi:MAG TPA: Crp/Fnr family transcriptional regulator [Sulfurovum sp.]|nr:Crp/Fnr family transcriptional regulator [Sulfurovum sp.]